MTGLDRDTNVDVEVVGTRMHIKNHLYVFVSFLLLSGMPAEGGQQDDVSFWLTVLHNDDAESQSIDAVPGRRILAALCVSLRWRRNYRKRC